MRGATAAAFAAPLLSWLDMGPIGEALAQDAQMPVAAGGWPRDFTTGAGKITVYAPQLDAWNGDELDARFAVAVQTGQQEPTFGVVFMTARTEVDKGARMVTLSNPTITKVSFPSAPDKGETFRTALQQQLQGKVRTIELDRLEAQLRIMDAKLRNADLPVKNDPPRVVFSETPAMLIDVDGTPVYRPVPDTRLQRVLNTRVLLLKDEPGAHYLHVFDGWMKAPMLDGSYVFEQPGPLFRRELDKALDDARKNNLDLLQGTMPQEEGQPAPIPPSLRNAPVPRIVVATVPTELIVFEGPPNYAPIEGTNLLYVSNTTGNVFKDTATQQSYVLLSGRWFAARSLDGPWQYVPGDKLPPDFVRIPDDSAKENAKASVPGTAQAQEAVIANSIPQTAEIKVSEAKMPPPQFDGAPQLKPIEGTSLQYVVNSSTPVIQVQPNVYYAVDNGVWFTGPALAGPWRVATSVPAAIYTIPPSSPLHYVTYVYVYRATPQVVYVGYTPGYYGTVVVNGVVVYGTGYAYTPWIGTYYYPPPPTYGYAVAPVYTPWTGWAMGFAMGWAWGRATAGWAWGPYPYWGPYAYYPRGGVYRGPYGGGAVWGPGGWAGTTGNVYHRWGSTTAVTRTSGGYNAWTGTSWRAQSGVSYNSTTGRVSAGQRGVAANAYTGNYAAGGRVATTNPNTGNTVRAGRVNAGNANTGQQGSAGYVKGNQSGVARVNDNVYAGHDGNVYKKTDSGWQSYSNGSWNNVQPKYEGQGNVRSTSNDRTGSAYQSSGRTNTETLNREAQARGGGYNRAEGFRNSSGGGYARGGGGRGGGGRGR